MSDTPGREIHCSGAVRYHAMDALRGAAMLLGIVLHACMSFVDIPFDIPWPQDRQQSDAAAGTILAIHLFRLQLFFLVAGFFARMLHDRLGAVGFLGHRARRVGLPLLLGMFTIVPLVGLPMFYGLSEPGDSIRAMLRERFMTVHLEMAHLWFLYFLLIYYVLTVCLLAPAARALLSTRLGATIDRAYRMLIRSSIKPVILGAVTMGLMYGAGSWHTIGLATQPVVPPRILLYYGVFFGIGWWLHRHVDLLAGIKRFKWTYLAMAGVSFVIMAVLAPFESRIDHPHYPWIELGAIAAANLYTWTMVFGVMGVFLAYLDVSRWYIRYLADASYWFYLAHLPIVVTLQVLLAGVAAPVWLKLAIILGVTLTLLAVTYEYAVRYTWVGTMLNGPRQRPTAPRVLPAEG